jgi:acyl dehydratase
MIERSSGIDGLKARIGTEWQAGVCQVERELVQQFVQAIGDPNPQWQNEECAPQTFTLSLGLAFIVQELAMDAKVTLLHGSTEFECYQSVMMGDTLTVTAKITDIRQRQGKRGKTAFFTFELTYTNQRQELIAICRQMLITY